MACAYEKRDFERVKVKTAITLYYGASFSRELEGICVDISDNGIGLVLDTVIAIGTECRAKVHDGHKNQGPYQALLEIKRIQPLEKGRCLVGASILEMF